MRKKKDRKFKREELNELNKLKTKYNLQSQKLFYLMFENVKLKKLLGERVREDMKDILREVSNALKYSTCSPKILKELSAKVDRVLEYENQTY